MSRKLVDTEDLRHLFDMVVNSMDFGSGFLDSDDVEVMRRLAELIGVDPMTGTPSEFRRNYPHTFEPVAPVPPEDAPTWPDLEYENERRADTCRVCSGGKDRFPHV